jgi:hypothetical protein
MFSNNQEIIKYKIKKLDFAGNFKQKLFYKTNGK